MCVVIVVRTLIKVGVTFREGKDPAGSVMKDPHSFYR